MYDELRYKRVGYYRGEEIGEVDMGLIRALMREGARIEILEHDTRNLRTVVSIPRLYQEYQKVRGGYYRGGRMAEYDGQMYTSAYGMKVFPVPDMRNMEYQMRVTGDWDGEDERKEKAKKLALKKKLELEQKMKHDSNIRKLYWARKTNEQKQ